MYEHKGWLPQGFQGIPEQNWLQSTGFHMVSRNSLWLLRCFRFFRLFLLAGVAKHWEIYANQTKPCRKIHLVTYSPLFCIRFVEKQDYQYLSIEAGFRKSLWSCFLGLWTLRFPGLGNLPKCKSCYMEHPSTYSKCMNIRGGCLKGIKDHINKTGCNQQGFIWFHATASDSFGASASSAFFFWRVWPGIERSMQTKPNHVERFILWLTPHCFVQACWKAWLSLTINIYQLK